MFDVLHFKSIKTFFPLAIILMAFLLPQFLAGCSFFGGKLEEETAEQCEVLGVSRECNTKLYAAQVSEIGRVLVQMLDNGQIKQTSYNFYAGLHKDATDGVNAYANGEGGLSDVADTLETIATFITTQGGTFDKIIDIFD